MKKDKLLVIQTKLNAPKNQRNNFWWFNYRSCEDILTAVKPLLDETKTALTLSDDIISVDWRFYIKATATLYDTESWEAIESVSALAREQEEKKWMDQSQITGAASSYARKYALNWLFCIDDSKDADAQTPAPTDVEWMLSVISNCKSSVALSQLTWAISQMKSSISAEDFATLKEAYNNKLKELK